MRAKKKRGLFMKFAFVCDIHADSSRVKSRIDDSREATMDKLEQIRAICTARGVTDVFLEGDVFNRPNVTVECISQMGAEFMKFRQSGIAVHSIVGNHDIYRNDLATLPNTALGLLGQFGAIDLMEKAFESDDCIVVPCHYTQVPEEAPAAGKTAVLMAHAFYDQSELFANDFANNIPKETMEKLGYDYAFLGHDHEEHPVTKCGKTTIVRSGSLLRLTRNGYNFARKPKFIILDETGIHEEPLACAPFDSIVARKEETGHDGVMADLASRLAVRNSETEDVIMKAIMGDSALDADCRAMILSYVSEAK